MKRHFCVWQHGGQADLPGMAKKPSIRAETATFESLYPAVADWMKGGGWVEVGYDDCNESFIRVLDIGGLIWEGQRKYRTVDEAFRAAEKALGEWLEENG